MRRLVLILLLCLVLPASAGAQSSPFGPLPQAAAPTATPAPVEDPNQSSLSRGVLFGIAGAVLVLFFAIGAYITRDARSHLTDEDRRALERESARDADDVEVARVRSERAKKKAREKTRAQKQARKKSRR